MEFLLLALLSYLAGSFPTGPIVTRLGRGVDVRDYGSGNTGAANVLRLMGPVGFAIVFVGDFAKGYLPVLVAWYLFGTPLAQVIAGLFALAGHNWSVFLKFGGGKGVVTGVAALFAISPPVGAVVTLVTVAIILASRYVSLGSLAGATVALVGLGISVALGVDRPEHLLYVVPGALIVIARHRDNITRLLRGTERKLGEPARPRPPSASPMPPGGA